MGGSKKVQDKGLRKSKYFDWVWSKDVIKKNDKGEKIKSTTFKSLVESLGYLICICPDILFRVRLMSRFIETPTMIHFKALKWILRYIEGIVDFGLFYGYSNSFEFVRCSNSD